MTLNRPSDQVNLAGLKRATSNTSGTQRQLFLMVAQHPNLRGFEDDHQI